MVPIMLFCQAITNPIGTYLQKRLNPKIILTIGAVVIISALLGASFSKTFWLFFYFYAIQFPLGVGLVYYLSIQCCWEWFPERKGFVTGIIMAGYPLGTLIFGFISKELLKHNSVLWMLLIITCISSPLLIIALVLIKRNPDFVRVQKIRERADKFYNY